MLISSKILTENIKVATFLFLDGEGDLVQLGEGHRVREEEDGVRSGEAEEASGNKIINLIKVAN